MARRAEGRTPMVARADLWLAEAAIPCRPRRAGISRSDLPESLYSARGVRKKELMAHLRTARQMRQAKGGPTKSGLGQSVSWAVKVLVGTIRRASAATCSVRGLTFMN